ncbi:carboxylesterase family protein [Variovorax sp. ZS18.2.2]|uniref:carboxylesterase/lipase family protein n=1 Tax=Variovorax sp. ZS18.2.2 TaxID=2971255 RepID=UPI002150734F|nr:carboxylesterase family protein [Variovorax sp. ZS18.2.2]MCR6476035.1 carboxylesterase family protein [Variovorax sp. ZS18.2.2]
MIAFNSKQTRAGVDAAPTEKKIVAALRRLFVHMQHRCISIQGDKPMNHRLSDFVRIAARWAIAALAALSIPAMAAYDQSLTRRLDAGPIKGQRANNETQSFLGIPFAKPPVGELRWRAPVPSEPWRTTRDATKFASMCTQMGSIMGELNPDTFGKPVGSEDCLYLNVWRPDSKDDNLPVFFWIHGGANLYGSASDPLYDAAQLAHRANMVVVTVQYRLGAFGWFNNPAIKTGDPLDDSGNFALLDLVRALDWTRTNARAFGGNPDLVTVAGQSAGCINTWSLLMSPLAKDKFQRALCMSGLPMAVPPEVGQAMSIVVTATLMIEEALRNPFGLALGSILMSPEDLNAKLLRNAKAETIAKIPYPLAQSYTDGKVLPKGIAVGLTPDYNKMPLMIGTTHRELPLLAAAMGFMMKPTQAELWKLANAKDPASVTSNQLIDPSKAASFAQISEVANVIYDGLTDVNLTLLQRDNKQIYRYNYEWNDMPQPWKDVFGATHASDVPTLFGNSMTDTPNAFHFLETPQNAKGRKALSDKFIDYTASFVRDGKPGQGESGDQMAWASWPSANCSQCNKRMIFDTKSYMSNTDNPSGTASYSDLSQPQRDLLQGLLKLLGLSSLLN